MNEQQSNPHVDGASVPETRSTQCKRMLQHSIYENFRDTLLTIHLFVYAYVYVHVDSWGVTVGSNVETFYLTLLEC
jgi:hypothetical protein